MPTKLDIVNDMLAATGTLPVTAANTRHPMYVKASTKLDLLEGDVLKMGLWFNTAYRTLEPDSAGQVYLPSDLVSFDVINSNLRLVRRGNRVYDLNKANFDIGEAIKCKLITEVDITDLPRSAYDYLRSKAVYEFYVNEEGTEPRLTNYRNQRNEAWTLLWREHISGADVNHFDNHGTIGSRLKHYSRASRPLTRPE